MDDGQNAATQSVGAGLREVRERLGWRLGDLATNLRIRLEFLEAIEAGNLQALPGVAYRAGFVRTYARALGLDPEEILRRFRAAGELHDSAKAEIRFIAPVPDSGVPKGAAILLGAVLLLAGYGVWYHYSSAQRRMAEKIPAVPAQLAPLATPPKIEVAPVTPAPTQTPAPAATQAAPPATHPTAPPATTPASSTQVQAAPATAPAATAAAEPATPVTGIAAPSATTSPPPPGNGIPTPASPAPGAGLVISATQDAWIEVQDTKGNILFSKVLHPGESWPVPQEPGLTMTTGNAGGTLLVNNGVAGAPLGSAGVVMRGIQLTPAAPGPQSPASASAATPPSSATGATATTPGGTP